MHLDMKPVPTLCVAFVDCLVGQQDTVHDNVHVVCLSACHWMQLNCTECSCYEQIHNSFKVDLMSKKCCQLACSLLSIAAELMAGARALSLANRHHFVFNLSGTLDKFTQCKQNQLLNVLAAKQRFEMQQINCDDTQTLSPTNSKLIRMDDCWCSHAVCTLNPVSPNPSGSVLVPFHPGPKEALFQLRTTFVIKSERSSSSLHFQHPRCVHGPTTLAQTLQRVCQNCSNGQINHSKMQHAGVPAMRLDMLWCMLHFAPLLSFSHKLRLPLRLTLLCF
mgnify:CR=1 FL=1